NENRIGGGLAKRLGSITELVESMGEGTVHYSLVIIFRCRPVSQPEIRRGEIEVRPREAVRKDLSTGDLVDSPRGMIDEAMIPELRGSKCHCTQSRKQHPRERRSCNAAGDRMQCGMRPLHLDEQLAESEEHFRLSIGIVGGVLKREPSLEQRLLEVTGNAGADHERVVCERRNLGDAVGVGLNRRERGPSSRVGIVPANPREDAIAY